MPQPSSSQVHVDAILTQISVAYLQAPGAFIATQAFPVVAVDKQSDLYYKFDKNDFNRDQARPRAGGTESAGSGYGLQKDSYSCDVFALHKDIDDQTRANADKPLDPDRDATLFLSQQILLRQEKQWSDDAFTTGVWATDFTGVPGVPAGSQFTQWDQFGSSDPIDDLDTGKAKILGTTGREANTLILGYDVYRKLKNHPDLIDRIKYSGEKVLTPALLAALFDLDRILVAKAVLATNVEGETEAFSFVAGKNALLCHVAPSPSLLTPSAGYTFAWKGRSGGLGTTAAVSKFRMEHLKSDRVEIEAAFDHKVVAADLGYFFSGAVA